MVKKNKKEETKSEIPYEDTEPYESNEYLAPPKPNPDTSKSMDLDNDDFGESTRIPPLPRVPRSDPVAELYAAVDNAETEYKNSGRFLMKPDPTKLSLFHELKRAATALIAQSPSETKSDSDEGDIQKTLLNDFVLRAKRMGQDKPFTTLFESRAVGQSLSEKLIRKIFRPQLIEEQLDREKAYEQLRNRKPSNASE